MAQPQDETRNWPELALGLYDRLTGRGAVINYELKDMQIEVPSKVGADADHAIWRVNGTLSITTSEQAN